MNLYRMVRVSILASLCTVLRLVLGAFPNIKPITAIFFLLASYFGFLEAWLVMALTMLVTGLLTLFGTWVFGQILSYSIILIIWTLFAKSRGWGLKKPVKFGQLLVVGSLVFLYGFLISLHDGLIYGFNPVVYWIRGLYFDGLHAVSTLCFYPIITYIFGRIFNHEKTYL